MNSLLISLLLGTFLFRVGYEPPRSIEGGEVMHFLQSLHDAQQASQKSEWKLAVSLWEEVTKQNPVTGDYWRELGSARFNTQDFRGAVSAYEQAMTLGLNELPAWVPYEIARCYGYLGDRAKAMEWFEKAMKRGYRNLENARNDPALKRLQGNKRFRELTAWVDTSKMSRVEGWRFDLKLLARELERRRIFPFLRTRREDFYQQVTKIHEAIPKLTDMQAVIEFAKLAAAMRDGHTTVYGTPSSRADLIKNLPLYMDWFQEGWFVTSADKRFSELLGAQILRVGDHDIQEIVRAVEPMIPRDNPNGVHFIGPLLMRNLMVLYGLGLVSDPAKVSLTIRDRNRNTRVVTLPADSKIPSRRLWDMLPENWTRFVDILPAPLPLYLKNPHRDYGYEYLPESKTVYLQWNHVQDDPQESLLAFFTRVNKYVQEHDVERMVIDLRWNNGGNTALVPPVLASIIQNTKINQPGKLFVLTSSYRTYSAAQNAATMLERYTHAIFVGDTTASSPNFIGEDVPIELPYSKVVVSISDVYWETSWPTDQRIWIPPLLYTPRTFASYAQNRDTALEAVFAYRYLPSP